MKRFSLAFAAGLSAPLLAQTVTPLAPAAITAPAQPLAAEAPIALLTDLGSGQVLFSRDPNRRFVPASITKVMTAYVAFDLLAHRKLVPNQRLTMSDGAFKEWANKGSTMFLARGSQPTVQELLMGITTVSANDGCIVLAEGAAGSVANWVALMNAQARALGMKDSHFGTPNGWPDNGATYVSAHDLTLLARAILTRYPQYYHHFFGHPQMTWNGITQPNHDPTLGVIPGADGMKTGFTNQAGYGFLGSAMRGGRRLVMVVAGVATGKARRRAAQELIEWGFAAWDSRRLYDEGALVGEARVQGGDARRVGLVAPHALFVALPGAGTGKIAEAPRLRVLYDGPVAAPIIKGAEIARLEVRIGNAPPHSLPLVAASAVGEAGPLDRLINGLGGLL